MRLNSNILIIRLVRVYSKAVLEAIAQSVIIEVEYYDVYDFIFEYSNIKLVDNEVRNNNLIIIDKDYSNKVIYSVISKNNTNLSKQFNKYADKIKVKYKNKEIFKKI